MFVFSVRWKVGDVNCSIWDSRLFVWFVSRMTDSTYF